MQFIQAKRLDNKLGVVDNTPFAIEWVRFINGGFELLLREEGSGKLMALTYDSLDWFREDFEVIENIEDLKE